MTDNPQTPDLTITRKGLGPPVMNACDALTGLTQVRLNQFTDKDLDEVFSQFQVGIDVRHALERFQKTSNLFRESQSDLSIAVMLMTTQLPNYGQSRWASLQFTEKFAKGLIAQIPDVQFPRTHVLNKLFDLLPNAATIPNLSRLLDDVECSAEVRYGEITSTKEQAYTAHKSSINIVKLITDTL